LAYCKSNSFAYSLNVMNSERVHCDPQVTLPFVFAHPVKSEMRTHRIERLRGADEIRPRRMEMIELPRKTICDAKADGAAGGLAKYGGRSTVTTKQDGQGRKRDSTIAPRPFRSIVG
jgi:hypothetical protein